MATTQRTTVVGVFENRAEAEQAVEELHRAGFSNDQIGFASRDGGAPEGGTAVGERKEAGEGAAKGAVTGGIVGSILGALATGLIPGIGPVLAGGLLAGILGGAAAGAATGGLFGALTGGLGVPEGEARYYDDEFQAGRTIVTVRADGRVDEADQILHRYGAYDVEHQGASATGTTTGSEGERTVQLREEELHARKQPVQTGEVQVRKEVVTEQRTIEVPVTREEVVVERRPVESRPTDQPISEGQTIAVPVREEQVTVEKRPVVNEEVEIGKRQVQDTERVSGTVRREEVRIEQESDVEVRGDVDLRGDPRWP